MSTVLPERRERGRPPCYPAELAARIIRLRTNGMSYEGISDVLNAEGIPMPGGGSRWLKSSIDRILHTKYAQRLAAELSAVPPTGEAFSPGSECGSDGIGGAALSDSPTGTPNSHGRTNACCRVDRMGKG